MTIPVASSVFRDYVTDGVPASGPNPPNKREIRALLAFYESILNGGGGAGLGYSTLALLNADLAHASNTTAIVYGDSTAANNGLYQKVGGSGSGSWTRIGDLPAAIVPLTVTGGTADAIIATAPQTPLQPGAKLYMLVPTATNTGAAMTIAINGGSATAIKNALGSTPAANTFVNGVGTLMFWSTDHYQALVSISVDTAGVVADSTAARDAAAASATAAASSASALGNQVHQYDTRALAIAATIPVGVQAIKITRWSAAAKLSYATYIPGTSSGPASFQEAGGHYWELDLGADAIDPLWFGVIADGSTIDDTAFANALTWAKARGKPVRLPQGTMKLRNEYLFDWNEAQIFGVSMRSSQILFDPTAHDKCLFTFRMAGVAGGLFNGALRDVTITTTGSNTFRKRAVAIYNGDCITMERVNLNNWYGSGSDVALTLGGREFTTVKQCLVAAEICINIVQNPDRALVGNIDCDMLRVTDLWLIGHNTTSPLITVDSGVNVTSLTFDGYQSWNLGAVGFVWNDTPTQIASMLSFYNVRYEQGAAGAFMFLLNRSGGAGLYNVHFQNCFTATSGYYLRGIVNATIINHASQGPGTSYGIDADGANVRSISLTGCNWIGQGAGVLKNLPTFTYKGGGAIAALPVSGELWSTSNPPPA